MSLDNSCHLMQPHTNYMDHGVNFSSWTYTWHNIPHLFENCYFSTLQNQPNHWLWQQIKSLQSSGQVVYLIFYTSCNDKSKHVVFHNTLWQTAWFIVTSFKATWLHFATRRKQQKKDFTNTGHQCCTLTVLWYYSHLGLLKNKEAMRHTPAYINRPAEGHVNSEHVIIHLHSGKGSSEMTELHQ